MAVHTNASRVSQRLRDIANRCPATLTRATERLREMAKEEMTAAVPESLKAHVSAAVDAGVGGYRVRAIVD